MWARLLLVGVLLSFSADLHAAGGGDGAQKSQTPVNSTCQLPADKGPCDKLELRWFYNSESKRCERFLYGGCYGNANNFKDINECDRRCVSPDLNKPGKCPLSTHAIDAFYGKHCSSDSSCPSTERCCATRHGKQCLRPSEESAGYCPLLIRPPSRRDGSLCFANCTDDFECFISDFHRTKCCPFENRKLCMEAVEEHPGVCPRRHEVYPFVPCNDTCIDDQDCPLTEKCCFTGCSRGCLPSVRSYQCQPPPDQDSCSKEVQRYYYDQENKECVSYRVCEDKSNNFETREMCEQACGKISKEVCKLPSDSGPCLAYSEFYYYNWKTKTCEIFVYGACQGNQNRFATKLECQMVCGGFEQQQEQEQQQQQQQQQQQKEEEKQHPKE
ncbi:papilin-like [Crotalus tigris]|uniref:papilin-like n=1 Tax=Crotalus tigris TaxID=88082 RepID=UPI00192F6E37|nr:papilin-like [Crotalus tigris]